DAEDDLEDHLQGDRRRPRAQGERLRGRPAVDLGGGDRRDSLAVALDHAPVERRTDELAVAQPLLSLEAEERGGADERLHHLPANLAGATDGAVGREHSPRELRLADVDEPRVAEDPGAEDRPEAGPAALKEGERIADELDRLRDGRRS